MERVTVDGVDLARAVQHAVRAVSRDPKLPVLGCVRFEASGGTLRLVATDRLRLAVSDLPVTAGDDVSFTALVDGTALLDAGIEVVDDLVTVGLDDGSLVIGSRALPMTSGDYPDYEPFLAGDPDARVLTVDRAALLGAIEDLDDHEPLPFRFTAGGLHLGERRLRADYDGPDVAFVLNPVFAHDAAEATAGPNIAIEATSPMRPVVFRSADPDISIAVVMPIRIAEPRRRKR
jgi:DNA polymerase III sliding clamp (beta) subunit (PCNA family)